MKYEQECKDYSSFWAVKNPYFEDLDSVWNRREGLMSGSESYI